MRKLSLAERVTQRPDVIIHGHPCSVGKLIASMDEAELAAFQQIMYGRSGLTEPARAVRGWTEAQVFDAVVAEGYEVAKSQINEHRGKRCRCYPRANS